MQETVKENIPQPEEKSNTSRRGKILSNAVSILLGAVVVLCLFVMVQVMSKGYVSFFGNSVLRVVTGSMEPEMKVGTLLLSQSVDIDEISEKDIICFRSKESYMLGSIITHRVVGVAKDEFGNTRLRTKGDANNSEDAYYVTADNLVGKVVWHTGDDSMISAIFSFLTGKIGFLSLIVIPALLVAGLILKDNVKALDKAVRELEAEANKEDTATNTAAKPTSPQLSEEEYAEMYMRLKAELMEEMTKGDTENNTVGRSEQSNNSDTEQ